MNTISNHGVSPLLYNGTEKRDAQKIGESVAGDNSNRAKGDAIGRGVHVTMSEHGHKVDEKYRQAVDSVTQQQSLSSASSEGTTGAGVTPVNLSDLPPIQFFNRADVKAYEKQLMAELASRGIDTSQRMDLATDFEGKVIVNNDHPDKEAIEATFREDKDLRNGFVQTSNFYLFREIYASHQQWANKIDSGVSEEVANEWLISTVQNTVSKSSQGITFEDGVSQDPFANDRTASAVMQAYQA